MPQVLLPQTISDGRLDTLLKVFSLSKRDGRIRSKVSLNWSRVQHVSPAGMAILACLFDTVVEQQCRLKNTWVKQALKDLSVIKNLNRVSQFQELPSPTIHNFQSEHTLLEGYELSLNLSFMERVEQTFQRLLSDELAFSCRLIVNELMVNCIDHSTAERYYLYAGPWNREFHIGVLDMGITIPAKLERKYKGESDVAFLEMALKEGISTRRKRLGGFGLHYTFEHLKQSKGRLTLVSRNAQLRRYFNSKSVTRGKLKHTLDGTWCFARFPLEIH